MVLYALVTLGMLVYTVVDVTTTPAAQVRTLPKPLWYLVLFLLPLLGSIAWLVAGRPRRGARPDAPAAPPVRPVAPDDDEDFLRELRRRSSDPRDDAA